MHGRQKRACEQAGSTTRSSGAGAVGLLRRCGVGACVPGIGGSACRQTRQQSASSAAGGGGLRGDVEPAAGAVAAGVSTAAKWAIVGVIRAGEQPLWSSFVWRTEVSDTFTEMVAAPWFARAAAGTPALAVWLRTLGAKIGRGVWCDSYWLPEPDLVTLGDASTVNRGCVVQTHLFHDRIMSMDTVELEPGSTLGPHSVVLPASTLGAHATVGPASLVMRGETVPVGSRWSGNPIGPWRAVKVRAYQSTT